MCIRNKGWKPLHCFNLLCLAVPALLSFNPSYLAVLAVHSNNAAQLAHFSRREQMAIIWVIHIC